MYACFTVIAFSCLLAGVSSGSVGDHLVDRMMSDLSKYLVQTHRDNMTIPIVYENFDLTMGSTVYQGELRASQGFIWNVSTIQRVGTVNTQSYSNMITLEATLTVPNMTFGFAIYRLDLEHTKFTGQMTVAVPYNVINAFFTVHYPSEGICYSSVEDLDVQFPDQFKLYMTGLDHFVDWPFTYVESFISEKYLKRVAGSLKIKLIERAGESLADSDICKLIQH